MAVGYEIEIPRGIWNLKIYAATWLEEPAQGDSLTKTNKKDRLLSYFHVRKRERELKRYVLTGRQNK